jgi:hypothetical protein
LLEDPCSFLPPATPNEEGERYGGHGGEEEEEGHFVVDGSAAKPVAFECS